MSDRVGCHRRSWSAYSGTDLHFPCRTLLCMPSASPRPLSPPRGAMHKTPRAHEITDRLSFSLTSLSNLRFFDFVVVFFLFVGFKSGTIRNALAAATSAHTDHRAHAVALKWEGDKGPLGIAPHQQAHAEQASTSSPQHCSGDTENEDARAAAATVVVAPKICCCCCCSGLTSGTVPPQHLGTITFPTSGGSDFDACVSARGLSLWEGRKEKEAALV